MADIELEERLAAAVIVECRRKRWRMEFDLSLADGSALTVIASADSFYTEHDSIWFGTAEEHEEEAHG